jgi:hypothetical protein
MRRARCFGLVIAALVPAASLVGPADMTGASPPPADTSPPTVPANLRVVDLSFNEVTLAWDPSNDDSGSANVDYETVLDARPADYQSWAVLDGSSRRYTLLHQGLTYTASVTALDGAGNRSAPATIQFTTPVDTHAPSTPTNVRFEPREGFPDGVLAWDASVDDDRSITYDVTVKSSDGATVAARHPRSLFVDVNSLLEINMLQRGVPYTVTVRARDTANNVSPDSDPLTVTF